MEDLLPFYLSIGVSYEKFMDSCPKELEPYDAAYKMQQNRQNSMAHMQGRYFADAILATIGNAFIKKGATPAEYPPEPYRIFPLTAEEIEENKQKELEKAIAYFDNLAEQSKRFKKK